MGSWLKLLGLIIYRLLLHPLARYPGPLLGRVTDVYSAYHAWTGKRHHDFDRLHQKYGPIVRYGPNSISFNSSAALPVIYGYKANVQKAKWYSAIPSKKGAWSTHSVIDRAMHARKRRVLAQAFSDSAFKGLQRYIFSTVDTFCDVIGDVHTDAARDHPVSRRTDRKDFSTPKDMGKYTTYMTYDALGQLCWGESLSTLERADNRYVLELIPTTARHALITGHTPLMTTLGLDRLFFRNLLGDKMRLFSYSTARLQKRAALGKDTDRRDFFYYLLQAKDPETGEGFALREMMAESNLLLVAGSDTTSTAFAAALFYLLHNPSYLAQLTSLIRNAFDSASAIIPGPELNGIRLLRAVMDESLRLSPPVPGILPREVLPGGLTVDGHTFPVGTDVGVAAHATHRNPLYFPDPAAFRPERWLGASDGDSDDVRTEKDAALKRAQAAFCPFSVGPRGCIGRGMAYAELAVAMARTLWRYDMRLAPGCESVGKEADGTFAIEDCFVTDKEGPVVQFRARPQAT